MLQIHPLTEFLQENKCIQIPATDTMKMHVLDMENFVKFYTNFKKSQLMKPHNL